MSTWNGNGVAESVGDSQRRTIPFDYTFEFKLEGKKANVLNRTVSVSVEASFSVVSVGYGVVPRASSIVFGIDNRVSRRLIARTRLTRTGAIRFPRGGPNRPPLLAMTPLDRVFASFGAKVEKLREDKIEIPFLRNEAGPEALLRYGFRLNPEFADLALGAGVRQLPDRVLKELFQTVAAPPERIQFRYAIFDEGTGRSFQSDPILSTAGLGAADGTRPFRTFTPSIVFAPRSTIRIDVTEVSEFAGDLSIVLHGYKQLGGQGAPTNVRRLERARRSR